MTYTELESAYIALCDKVVQDTRRIAAFAGVGRADDAGRAAVSLMDIAVDAKEQYVMQQESTTPTADRYNLNALKVDTTAASNSETGWERED